MQLNFSKVSKHSINCQLENEYQAMFQIVKSIIAGRDPSNVLCVSFDKWTTSDMKFLGIYLYIEKQKVCLGMIHYTGFCGTEKIFALIKKHFQLYILLPSDITICVVDCGAVVQAVANVFNWFSFPCLAHNVNLCLRKFILEIDEKPGQEIESDDDEDESDTSNVNETTNIDLYVDVIKEAAKCVRDIKRSPKLHDKLAETQRMMNRPVLKVVLDNATRWNSLLDMLLRFNEMKDVLVFITDDRLSNYNWEKSKKTVLKPLKECALEL